LKAKNRGIPIPVSQEAYDLLANRASHLNMTPDGLANTIFQYYLSRPDKLQEIIDTIKQQKLEVQTRAIKPENRNTKK
jgi:hypothetical protein